MRAVQRQVRISCVCSPLAGRSCSGVPTPAPTRGWQYGAKTMRVCTCTTGRYWTWQRRLRGGLAMYEMQMGKTQQASRTCILDTSHLPPNPQKENTLPGNHSEPLRPPESWRVFGEWDAKPSIKSLSPARSAGRVGRARRAVAAPSSPSAGGDEFG